MPILFYLHFKKRSVGLTELESDVYISLLDFEVDKMINRRQKFIPSCPTDLKFELLK